MKTQQSPVINDSSIPHDGSVESQEPGIPLLVEEGDSFLSENEKLQINKNQMISIHQEFETLNARDSMKQYKFMDMIEAK